MNISERQVLMSFIPLLARGTFWLLVAGALATSLFVSPVLRAADAETETPEAREARMLWWREARFGMFVHWGLYSGLAGNWNGKKAETEKPYMEWLQNWVKADTDTYAAQALPLFRPKPGFAREWARL